MQQVCQYQKLSCQYPASQKLSCQYPQACCNQPEVTVGGAVVGAAEGSVGKPDPRLPSTAMLLAAMFNVTMRALLGTPWKEANSWYCPGGATELFGGERQLDEKPVIEQPRTT